jgi:hypothetical protein
MKLVVQTNKKQNLHHFILQIRKTVVPLPLCLEKKCNKQEMYAFFSQSHDRLQINETVGRFANCSTIFVEREREREREREVIKQLRVMRPDGYPVRLDGCTERSYRAAGWSYRILEISFTTTYFYARYLYYIYLDISITIILLVMRINNYLLTVNCR